MGDATVSATDDPASLAASLLAEEARRQSEQHERSARTVLPDDLLPGVGGERMSMRETLREGGVATILVICFVVVVEQIGRVALGVLGPDVQATMGISDTTLVGVASFGSVALVLGAVPLAWLADHVSRKRIVVLSLFGGAAGLALTGLVVNPFQLFWALSAVGFAAAYGIPVFGSLMADAYPIHGRARIFALFFMAQPLGQLVGPFLVGLIANVAGGREGWRWVYFVAGRADRAPRDRRRAVPP